MEAALSLGMSTRTALRRVIVPQAMRIVIPPVTNDFIALFKDTSVCTMISVVELTGMYRKLFNEHPQLMLEFGMITALLYLVMSYPLSLVARRMETQFKKASVTSDAGKQRHRSDSALNWHRLSYRMIEVRNL